MSIFFRHSQVTTEHVTPTIAADYDADHNLASIEILDASTVVPVDRPDFKSLIEAGLKDVEAGRTISHEEMLERIAGWRRAVTGECRTKASP